MSVLQLVLMVLLVGVGSSQNECQPPTPSDIENVIGLIIREGEASLLPDVTLLDHNIVCRAFGRQQDLLRGVSVVVEYTCSGANCPVGTVLEQIESECEDGQWKNEVAGSTTSTDLRTQSPEADLSTTPREDCSFCISPVLAGNIGSDPDNVTHCVDCDPACKHGFRRCYEHGPNDCCNFYNDSMCIAQCQHPFGANMDNICVCPDGKTGISCQDDVFCNATDLGTLENGFIDYVGVVYNSVAIHFCDDGYKREGNTFRICTGTGKWTGSVPTCIVDCDDLTKPTNGYVAFSDTVLDSEAVYFCEDGYTLEGDPVRTCLASGDWSGGAPTCKKACPVLGCDSCESDDNKCDQCSSDKVFNDRASVCVDRSFVVEQCESCEDTDGLVAGIIVLAVLLLIALVALTVVAVFVIYLLLSKKSNNKTQDVPSNK